MTKQSYIHSRLNIVLCLPFHDSLARNNSQHPFQLCQETSPSVRFELVIHWQELLVAVKKDVLALFVRVNALLFSIQYGHVDFSCVLQPETIL